MRLSLNFPIANIDEFFGLSAFEETPEEAAKEARTAAGGIIKVMEKDGEPVPEPKTIRRVARLLPDMCFWPD